MKGFFDSHAHYYDPKFAGLGGADAVLQKLFGDGTLDAVINVATNPENAQEVIRQAAGYPRMYAAVGIHPEDCFAYDTPEEPLEKIREIICNPIRRRQNKVVAIGEIGLDYYWNPSERERQAIYFDAQMEMARTYDLPVIIHDREAHGDCFETVLRHPGVKGVFHSYSGSAEMARELVRRGWYISFSGVVTFRNASRVREVAASVPTERLLVETDCPYLAPHPYRGQVNHSGYLEHTAAVLAELHGLTQEQLVQCTAENAKTLFRMD